MNKPKISILGCGWLGLSFGTYLVEMGYEVKGSTTRPEKLAQLEAAGLEAHLLSIEDFDATKVAFLEAEILIVCTTMKVPNAYQQLIEHIEKSRIQQLLLISTSSVYLPSEQLITEESPLDAENPWVGIEQLFCQSRSFLTTVLRFGGLFGNGREPARWFRNSNGRKVPDGVVNLIHLTDCLKCMAAIIEQGYWGHTLHACADTHPSKREFYTKACRLAGFDAPEFAPASSRKELSNEKIKQALGIEFTYADLMQALDAE